MSTLLNTDTELNLDFKDHDVLELEFEANSHGTLNLNVQGSGAVEIRIHAHAHAQWKVLWINHSHDSLTIREDIFLHEGADVRLIYGELSLGSHTKDTKIHLVGVGAQVELIGAVLAFGKLAWSMQADHRARNTQAHLNTNAIILDNAHLKMEVEGKIAKGFGGSKTHQMTRILNLGSQTQGIVFPKLLIDENDVEASHAASVGQANEEHVYYLQSRGLSKIEALRLMIKGYLAPVIAEIDNPQLREKLMDEVEKKVSTYVK